jgi:iron(III) transport system ATP-binding protein
LTTITVSGLHKSFGKYSAIRGADLQADDGEFVTLLGESGCGKTTTLRCISGLEHPDSGHIAFGDRVVFDSDKHIEVPPERRRIGMVFQSYALWPHMTVLETVLYPLKRHRVRGAQAIKRARELLAAVDMETYAERMATSLSGGQQQRIALARALVAKPELVLYDEPLSNLDPSLRKQIREQIKDMHTRNGTTSLYVTHDLDEAMYLSDRVVVMQSGLLEQSGTPAQIFSAPATEYVARFVGYENLLAAQIDDVAGDTATINLVGTQARMRFDAGGRPGRLSSGQRVTLGFRAENAFIGSADRLGDGALKLHGTIRRVSSFGSRNEYTVSVGATDVNVVESERSVHFSDFAREPGEPVLIEIDPRLCCIIPAADRVPEPVREADLQGAR